MSRIILFLSVLSLLACKPELEVHMSTDDIESVMNDGSLEMITFEAIIEDNYTTMDEDMRAEVKAAASVLRKYFKNSELDYDIGVKGFEIEIEGEFELTMGDGKNLNPWFFKVSKIGNNRSSETKVVLSKSLSWDDFANELKEINFMAKPKDYLPVKIKLKNDGGELLLGGAILDGQRLSGYHREKLDGDRVTLTFKGEHWENVPAGFLYIQSSSKE